MNVGRAKLLDLFVLIALSAPRSFSLSLPPDVECTFASYSKPARVWEKVQVEREPANARGRISQLRKNGVPTSTSKEEQNVVIRCNLKGNRISRIFRVPCLIPQK